MKVFLFQDHEEELSSEVVIELAVDGDTRTALQRWANLASIVDGAKASMPAEERNRFDQCLAVHLTWRQEP